MESKRSQQLNSQYGGEYFDDQQMLDGLNFGGEGPIGMSQR